MSHEKRPQIEGADDREHHRSAAALRVAQLAAASDLFFFNYEYRKAMPLPEWMAPPEAPPRFQNGVLPELKYQAFRHDLLIGSFNPAHRAKWTAHELCHLLVGFAYRPNMPPGFQAIGAWLAELLPVALYYFFDEIDLRRCARHQGGGPLYRQYCPECERAALLGPVERRDERFERDGMRFVDRELAAIERARRTGELNGSRFGSIDLASDAIAYAAAHRVRLESGSFERLAAEFFSEGGGLHSDLDQITGRLLEVMEGVLRGAPVRPLEGDRYERMAQDLGYRLLLILEETEGEAWRELDRIIALLAERRSRGAIGRAINAYAELAEEYELPEPEDVFAVGYALPEGQGFALEQIAEGLESCVPSALEALIAAGSERAALISDFMRESPAQRAPLGRRFADYLTERGIEPAASHARLEAALIHAAPLSSESQLFRALPSVNQPVLLAPSAELIRSRYALESELPPDAVPEEPRDYLVMRTFEGEVLLMLIESGLADAIESGEHLSSQGIPLELLELGFFVAEARSPILR